MEDETFDRRNSDQKNSMDQLPVVYEDDDLLVVNKPSGMLSQPGRYEDGSVLTRVLHSGRELTGPVLVHRLDMDTSGLLLLAKNRTIHRLLGKLFETRQIQKRYQASLENPVDALGGSIHLPIRLDIDNRPRQIVCAEHGKFSATLWHRRRPCNSSVISLYPLTGRTHQLRVHAASADGLGNPIAGDRLYGTGGSAAQDSTALLPENKGRLMLHADRLAFIHPSTQQSVCVDSPAPF